MNSQAHADVLQQARILDPGTKLGRYELVRRLAIGGMAELYLARATGIQGFEKLVALKRILPQYADSDEFEQMFLDEARLVATLQHPNIAQVYDIGQSSDGLFFTMELVQGEDVRSVINATGRKGMKLPLEHALAIVCGAAAGLHAAHERTAADGSPLGIVHRDVSPSNVLVSYDGCVKMIDFGIAKAACRGGETRAGTLKGKIAYMSPEQCSGLEVDRRSDVFALGILLYELTTGGRLFQADNEFTIMKQIVHEDVPPPSSRRIDFPAALELIILRALRRERGERYATAQELQLELEAFARSEGLVLSSVELGHYMKALFPARVEAWRREGMVAAMASLPPAVTAEGTPSRRRVGKGSGSAKALKTTGQAAIADLIAAEIADGDDAEIVIEQAPLETWMFGAPRARDADASAPKRQRAGGRLLGLAFAMLGGAAAMLAWMQLRDESTATAAEAVRAAVTRAAPTEDAPTPAAPARLVPPSGYPATLGGAEAPAAVSGAVSATPVGAGGAGAATPVGARATPVGAGVRDPAQLVPASGYPAMAGGAGVSAEARAAGALELGADVADAAAAAGAAAKKADKPRDRRAAKPRAKRPRGWDPDSPLPPPAP